MKKRYISSILASAVVLSSLSMTALAASPIAVSVDGQKVTFSGQSPEIKNGVTYVPVRGVFEKMGATVTFVPSSDSVEINANNVKIKFAIGANTATVMKGNKTEQVKLESSTYLKNDRAMVPLRFASETLGYDVTWNAKGSTITIASNTAKALALIGSFATGDTSVAEKLLQPDYIQHNLAYGTGRDAFESSVAWLAKASVKTTVKNIRAFADGDYVFLQNQYNFAGAGEQVAFDVFRFEDGKIAEHWDNIANLATANPSGHTQIDGTTKITDLSKTEANKAVVKNFVEDVLMGKNAGALTSYFNGNNYIQHNKDIADGLDGLGAALNAWAAQGITMQYTKTHLLLGEGNFVLVGSEGTLGGASTAFYDLFRVENGKIAEHWDIIDSIPDQSKWANQNGKFGTGNVSDAD